MNRRTTRCTLAILLLLVLPASAADLDASGATDAVTDTQGTLDTTWNSPTVDITRPVICTPNNGNDYWVDYCVTWTTSDETVRYVKDAHGNDPWCVVYPVPCAPSPADPIQWATTTARLSYLETEASVDSNEVCNDTTGSDCPQVYMPSLCTRLVNLCNLITFSCAWPCAASSDDIALADIDSDTMVDGVAIRMGSTWTYVGMCDDHTLSFECIPHMTMQVVPPTRYAEVCTPPGDDYWVDHCTEYEQVPITAYTHRAAVAPSSNDLCIIYPVPCAPSYEAQVVVDSVNGDLYRYHHTGELDDGEVLGDACQVVAICANIAIAKAMNYVGLDLDWAVIQNAGLMDTDGDGWAEGLAVGYVPAWVDTSYTEIMLAATTGLVSIPYEYVPFSCLEVHPVTLEVRVPIACSFAVTPIVTTIA